MSVERRGRGEPVDPVVNLGGVAVPWPAFSADAHMPSASDATQAAAPGGRAASAESDNASEARPAPQEVGGATDGEQVAAELSGQGVRQPQPSTRPLRTRGLIADVWALLGSLDLVGRVPGGGYARHGLTDVDRELREWFEAQANVRDLEYEVDSAGNQWAWWRAERPDEVPKTDVTRPATPGADTPADQMEAAGAAERATVGEPSGLDAPAPRPENQPAPPTEPDPVTSDLPVELAGAIAEIMAGDITDQRCIVVGSHLDSVPRGGAFDGPLGVCSAFAAIDRLRACGLRPVRDIAIVNFFEEEGSRFSVACLGSRILTGALPADEARALRDSDGTSLADAWRQFGLPGLPGPDPDRVAQIGRYVELHIEQGIAQADLGAPVAASSGIWPHGRWRVQFTGQANHAGTTPMRARRDPMLKLARLIEAVRAAAVGNRAVATVGKVVVDPGGVNAIPGRVDAWVDVRAAREEAVRAVIGRLAWANPVEESWTPAIRFDEEFAAEIAAAIGEARAAARARSDVPVWLHPRRPDPNERPVPTLGTGAGHDAGILSLAGVTAGMMFVRNETGISHAPEEYATREDCEAGVAALAALLGKLATAATLDGAVPLTGMAAVQRGET